MEIAGCVAVVTGAAAGTGRVIARRLAAEGATVVVADIDEQGEEVASAIGGRFVRADVRAEADVRRLVDAAQPRILVNNAGGGGHVEPHLPDASPADWGATLDLNLRGPMLATSSRWSRCAGRAAVRS